MTLAELQQRLQKTNMLNKETRQAVLTCIQRLAFWEARKIDKLIQNPPTQLTRKMQNEFTQIKGFADQTYALAQALEGYGWVDAALLLHRAQNLMEKAYFGMYDSLYPAERKTMDRVIRNTVVACISKDTARKQHDSDDDPSVEVSTETLYEFAQYAIAGCCTECDGNKAECKLRDIMATVRIPINPTTGRECPYWNEK